jgi:hypothetical protein
MRLFVAGALLLDLLCSTRPSSAQSTSSVRIDGTILCHGQPIFPVSFPNLLNRDANGAIT